MDDLRSSSVSTDPQRDRVYYDVEVVISLRDLSRAESNERQPSKNKMAISSNLISPGLRNIVAFAAQS